MKQISQETGKGQWAIRKQFQRSGHRLRTTQEQEIQSQPQEISIIPTQPVPAEQPHLKKVAVALGAFALMLATFVIYLQVKESRKSNNDS
jgi:hypothetical protein